MQTEVIKIDPSNIDHQKIKYAANAIKNGGVVAFPTETVYGLGANVFDENAVKKIFIAKGRPADNPLIAHIADQGQLKYIVTSINQTAINLMTSYWPGPLTLVMEKQIKVPDIVSGGLNTVAVRMPNHPVALSLIRESNVPLVAPSANTSGRPSPTRAEHVIDDLNGKVDIIIDSGNTEIGIESTVVDAISEPPIILRPGGLSQEDIIEIAQNTYFDTSIFTGELTDKVRSPGMKYRHYSPKAKVIIIKGDINNIIPKINELLNIYKEQGKTCGVLATEETKEFYKSGEIMSVGNRNNLLTISANLFNVLRKFDEKSVEFILVESFEEKGLGIAIMNRLYKASGYNIIYS